MHFLRFHYDKLLLLLAIAALGGSLDWVRRQPSGHALQREHSGGRALSTAAFTPAARQAADPPPVAWTAPLAQSRGAGWLYEVFTPPELSFNASERTFAPMSAPPVGGEPAVRALGWELLEVKSGEFRLQLAGYFGSPADYLVAFLCPQSGEIRLARVGQCFADLGLAFETFAVRKVQVAMTDAGEVLEGVAFAGLRDEWDAQTVVLDSRKRRLTGEPIAVLRKSGRADRRELREGDTLAEAGALYRIERIRLEPAEVVVRRMESGVPVAPGQVLRRVASVAHPGPAAAPSLPLAADRVAGIAP